MLSEMSREMQGMYRQYVNVEFLYQNIKGDYDIIVRGIKSELQTDKDNIRKLIVNEDLYKGEIE